MAYTLDQAVDIGYGTLQAILRKKPPLANYAYTNYQFFNTFFKGNLKTRGDELEGHVTLDSEDNARATNFWAEDTLIKKNINKKYTLPWRYVSTGMMWNIIESAINKGPEQIYNVWETQYNSMVKDLVEKLYLLMLTGPTSASDTDNPYSLFNWLSCGTEETEAFNGYKGYYDDGTDVDSKSGQIDKGGLTSSASVNTGWASYYADHEGNIDDSLLTILDTALRKLNFQAPIVPEKLPMEKVNFATYTTNNVIKKLNAYLRKSDDNMGYRPEGYLGVLPSMHGTPMVWCDVLDTARTDIYGTDPIIGVNHQVIYPVVLEGFNFVITKRPDALRHNVMSLFMDWVGQIWCNTSPRYGGFLISQHPASD